MNKSNDEFNKFDQTMRELLKVPHSRVPQVRLLLANLGNERGGMTAVNFR